MVDYITIEDVKLLYKATFELLELLRERIESDTDPVNLNQMLFKRVWRAALKCAGFTQVQKDDIAFICGVDDTTAREMGVGPFAAWWKCLYTIGPKSNFPDDTIMVSQTLKPEIVAFYTDRSFSGMSLSSVST